MANFEQVDYTDFVTDYTIRAGELATEQVLNAPSKRLKKELNNVYNIINILNGKDIMPWRDIEDYVVGEICQNTLFDNNVYRARRINNNRRPDLFPDEWEVVTNKDFTISGDFSNYLSKSNTEEYTPTGDYNPATKKYIDFALGAYVKVGETVDNARHLNGETVQNILGISQTAPASVNLVKILDEKVDTKLNATEFNSTAILNMMKGVDGAGTGLDADLLDGHDTSYFMVVDSTANLNTLKRPGTYLANPGTTGLPNSTSTFSILVSGNGTVSTQIATDVTQNKVERVCVCFRECNII
jgi:hypothetical protein